MPDAGRLGKLPPRFDARTLRLRDYLPSILPPPPASITYDHGIRAWGMLANDRIGDCTCAAVGHSIQLATANTASEVTIPDSAVIAAYSAVTGYDPHTGANDNGAVELDVLKYWQQAGVGGHRCAAYADCSVANHADVKDCIALLGFCYIGFAVPKSAMDQFAAGQPWEVPATPSPIVGGHAVVCVDFDATGLTCITWGSLQRLSWAFWDRYVDEAHGVVTPEWVAANGLSPSGLNLAQLLADVAQLTGQPQPPPPAWAPDPNLTALYTANATGWAWCRDQYAAAGSAADAKRVNGYASALIAADDNWRPYLAGKSSRAGQPLPEVP